MNSKTTVKAQNKLMKQFLKSQQFEPHVHNKDLVVFGKGEWAGHQAVVELFLSDSGEGSSVNITYKAPCDGLDDGILLETRHYSGEKRLINAVVNKLVDFSFECALDSIPWMEYKAPRYVLDYFDTINEASIHGE